MSFITMSASVPAKELLACWPSQERFLMREKAVASLFRATFLLGDSGELYDAFHAS
jgi:hypothetical protein